MYAPFGFKNRYADDVPFRTVAEGGNIQYLTFNPVVAVQLSRTFSVAAGLTVNYSKAELVNGVVARGDEFRFEGDDTALGFNLGIMWQPTPKHSFGLTYWSGTSLNYDGYSHLQYDPQTVTVPVAPGVFAPVTVPGVDHREHASARLEFPAHVTGGYSFRPTPNWNLEADLDWTEWEGLDTATSSRNPATWPSPSTTAPRSSTSSASPATSDSGTSAAGTSTASGQCRTRSFNPSCRIQNATSFRSALAENMIM